MVTFIGIHIQLHSLTLSRTEQKERLRLLWRKYLLRGSVLVVQRGMMFCVRLEKGLLEKLDWGWTHRYGDVTMKRRCGVVLCHCYWSRDVMW